MIKGPPLEDLDWPYYVQKWLANHKPTDSPIMKKKGSFERTDIDDSFEDDIIYSTSTIY